MSDIGATWWVTTAPLSEGGNKVAGPYPSQEEALQVRAGLKTEPGGNYWVDDEPVSVPEQEG